MSYEPNALPFVTHMSHDLDHETTNAVLPPGMELAYDGMSIPLESNGPQTV